MLLLFVNLLISVLQFRREPYLLRDALKEKTLSKRLKHFIDAFFAKKYFILRYPSPTSFSTTAIQYIYSHPSNPILFSSLKIVATSVRQR